MRNQIDYLSYEFTCVWACTAQLLEPKGALCLVTMYFPLLLYIFKFLKPFFFLNYLKSFIFLKPNTCVFIVRQLAWQLSGLLWVTGSPSLTSL